MRNPVFNKRMINLNVQLMWTLTSIIWNPIKLVSFQWIYPCPIYHFPSYDDNPISYKLASTAFFSVLNHIVNWTNMTCHSSLVILGKKRSAVKEKKAVLNGRQIPFFRLNEILYACREFLSCRGNEISYYVHGWKCVFMISVTRFYIGNREISECKVTEIF